MTTNIAIVDDRDSLIHYAGTWSHAGVSEEFDSTTTFSLMTGCTATFPFVGTGIQIYGGVTSATETASIVLDGGPPTFWVPPSAATQTNNLMYTSDAISPGNHTLVVTATSDQPVWADYWLITPNPVGFVDSSSGSISTQISHKRATLVGAVLGVLALIALMAVVFFGWRRCNQYRTPSQGEGA
ncbi:hypothetical protein C8R45DRAFT_849438 [Mycena sanguinolenta]|nr:hypothetical protein C8R45DRAFT_849438 [Mycena sanguinolenta]